MEQLTKNQAVATSQEAVQNQNEPQLRDENAHNDKSVRSEERFSRNAETDLVCRLLLEKKDSLSRCLPAPSLGARCIDYAFADVLGGHGRGSHQEYRLRTH